MNYYYLIASLPSLALEAEPPFDPPRFEALGREHLTPPDQAVFSALLQARPDQPPPNHPFCRAWHDRETLLRNAVVRLRAARRNVDPAPFLRPTATLDLSLEKAVAEAFTRPHPGDRELELDRIRWRTAEELAGYDPFAFDALLAYAVRFGLVTRRHGLTEPRGRERLESLLTL